MRKNLPVTQREYVLQEGTSLVSVTDPKGRITYCNDDFVQASGFAREELLGQPHNLVRHPDMPEEAFRDLWDTVASGRQWTALVKNRRKDGDHYWVRANVTPMLNGQRVSGYLSVRSVPTRDEVQAAESLYAKMREPGCTLSLRRGELVRHDMLGRLWGAVRRASSALDGIGFLIVLTAMLGVIALDHFAPLVVSVPVAVLAAMAVGFLHHRTSVKQLERIAQDAQRLAACDLSHLPQTGAPGSYGQIQLALMQLGVNLRAVIRDTNEALESVRSAVKEIADGNQDLSSRTESQASSLEETAASMEQITGTVRQSAAHAGEGARLALDTTHTAQMSHEAVGNVAHSMRDIKTSSQRVGEIIQTIEGVAFQTNILALNAAVEAARAGDAGRGFAVVADEVRALAQRTDRAAKEIRQLILDSTERVDVGANHVEQANERMASAMQAVQNVADVLEKISLAAAEQQSGIAQVNEAVAHMDAMTQQNAAMVEELAAAAASVIGQVNTASNTMRVFRLSSLDRTIAEEDAVALRTGQASASTAAAKGIREPAVTLF